MTRRDWLALSGGFCFSACARPKGSGYSGYAIVATAGDQSLSVVDLKAFRLQKQVALGGAPSAIITAPHSADVFALLPEDGTVVALDHQCAVRARFHLASELSAARLTADGKTLVAISGASRELIFADSGSGHVIRRVVFDAAPTALDLGSDDAVAVVFGAAGRVELFTAAGKHSTSHLEGALGAARFRMDGKLLIVARSTGRSLTALTVPDLQVLADLPLAMRPDNFCFTPDGGQLFVTGEGMDAVAIVFPYKTLEVEQPVLAGRDPGVMACSASPVYLFVANASGSDISILDVENRRVIGILQVGQRPDFIAITPDNQYALILHAVSGDMGVVRIPAIRPNRAKKNGVALFTLLPVGKDPVHAAVIAR